MSFAGMRVLSLESRRAAEMAELIRKQGGEPVVAPSMREAPIENNDEAFRFGDRLAAGAFDMMIFLTGVGARVLRDTLAARRPPEQFADSLRRVTVVARGPKPVAAMREMDVPVAIRVPPPNTWREVLSATEGRPERAIAVQEYGRPVPELIDGLRARGAEVTTVRAYRWEMPEDAGPLRDAARALAGGGFDAVLFTTAIQVVHLFRAAAEEGIEAGVAAGLRKALVFSIGPTTTEMLEDYGIRPALEPSQSKMGVLVKEAAERAPALK